jgi:alanine racemase
MVDVSNIKCKEGDQVIIFDEVHTAEDLCCSADTISYELISGISTNRITRSIIE